MTYEIYIKEHDDKFLEIGTAFDDKKFGLLCERNLRHVTNGIEAALNSIRAVITFGEKALKNGDIDVEFMFQQTDYDQEKVKVDYKIVLK